MVYWLSILSTTTNCCFWKSGAQQLFNAFGRMEEGQRYSIMFIVIPESSEHTHNKNSSNVILLYCCSLKIQSNGMHLVMWSFYTEIVLKTNHNYTQRWCLLFRCVDNWRWVFCFFQIADSRGKDCGETTHLSWCETHQMIMLYAMNGTNTGRWNRKTLRKLS